MNRIFVAIAVSVFAVELCVADNLSLAMPPLRPHRGDGKFEDISWRYPWVRIGVPVRGYHITFPSFGLGEEYTAEFAVSELPDIKQPVGIYLFVSDSDRRISEDFRRSVSAEWQFDLLDSSGTIVTSCNKPLSKLTWCTPLRMGRGYGIYSSVTEGNDSFFSIRKGERYTLRIKYRPDPKLRPFRGCLYLECGGEM